MTSKKNNYLSFGFKSTLGSFGAMALLAIPAIIGILLILSSKNKETGERNNVQFGIGVVLVILSALPYIPLFGLSLLTDSFSD